MNDQHDENENEKPEVPKEDQNGQQDLDQGPKWESDLDTYPLREAKEDPRWALRTVWIWVSIAMAAVIFILTLLVLGAIYD